MSVAGMIQSLLTRRRQMAENKKELLVLTGYRDSEESIMANTVDLSLRRGSV
jgi:hypothetical protein